MPDCRCIRPKCSVAPAMLEILRQAAACPRLTLAVISGRALADVRRRLPLEITFAGNHGLEIAGSGLDFEHAGRAATSSIARRGMRSSGGALCANGRPRGSKTKDCRRLCISAKWTNAITMRFSSKPGAPSAPSAPQLALRVGNRALEVRPKVQWDKGSALQYIQRKAGPFHACVCIGDDRTDETMFRANRGPTEYPNWPRQDQLPQPTTCPTRPRLRSCYPMSSMFAVRERTAFGRIHSLGLTRRD